MNNYFKYNSTTIAPVYDEPVISVAYNYLNFFNMTQDVNRLLNVISDNTITVDNISGLTDLVEITEAEFNALKEI